MAREDETRGIAFDAGSVREVDENGFLHVAVSPLTREQVAPYYGYEIPGAEQRGLDPQKVYMGWRPAEELRRPETLKSVEGIPIQLAHHPDYADAPAKETRVGLTGTDAEWRAPYLMNSLHILDKEAQQRIQDGSMRELSLAYSYVPDFAAGTTADGEHYDFIMRDILANHVALVKEGRAGPKVLVYDSKHGDVMEKESFGAGAEFEPAAEALEVFLNSLPSDLLKKALAAQAGPEEEVEDEEPEEAAEADEEAAPEVEHEPEAEDEDEDAQEADEEAAARSSAPAPEEKAEDDGEELSDAQLIEDAGMSGEPEAVQRAFLKGIHYRKQQESAQDEDPEPEEKPAGSRCIPDAKKIAQDAARRVRDTFVALEEVRPVLGRVRIGAYDSAGDVYRAALKKAGVPRVKRGAERAAFAAYIAGTKKSCRGIAQDSAAQGTAGGLMAVMAGVKTNF